MAEFSLPTLSFLGPSFRERANEQNVTVPPGHNAVSIRLSRHTYVSVFSGEHEVVTSHRASPAVTFSVAPGMYQIRSDGVIESATSEQGQLGLPLAQMLQRGPVLLQLTSDAEDRHAVDGIGEIPADGTSFTTITVEKIDVAGAPLSNQEETDELFLRTTGGVLMDAQGKARVRSVTMAAGKASFRLVSDKEARVVTVSVLARDPLLANGEILVEFIFPAEKASVPSSTRRSVQSRKRESPSS